MKWQRVFFMGPIFLLVSLVIGCGYTEVDLEATRELAYDDGYRVGLAKGESAKQEAVDASYDRGYEAGYAELESVRVETAKYNHEIGYLCGYQDGQTEGYHSGYQVGYEDGQSALEEEQVIEDLAYIEVRAGSYTDDADPESEGISLYITFYDSKSERIVFQDTSVTLSIKLYGYRNTSDYNSRQNRELVYKEELLVDIPATDSTGLVPLLLPWDIVTKKIPFEKIAVDQSRYIKWGNIEVIVTTPQQGDFQDSWSLVSLYDE